MSTDADPASAARRVAEDIRRNGNFASTRLDNADALALLPILDAVAVGRADEGRAERWQRELARMDGLGFNWPRYGSLARAAMALADAERAVALSR